MNDNCPVDCIHCSMERAEEVQDYNEEDYEPVDDYDPDIDSVGFNGDEL